MTNKKFIAYNLIATGFFILLIVFSTDFFSKNEMERSGIPNLFRSEFGTDIREEKNNANRINKSTQSVSPIKKIKVTATHRENITFILGEDETPTENYYASATHFYRNHPTEKTEQLITTCRSILEVRNHLADHYAEGALPWGKINLVVHGNEWSGLGVATLPRGRRTTIQSLEAAINNGQMQPLPNHIADACTEIHIHGCAVGRNTYLLEAIGKAFGAGHPLPVHSSPYFVRYEPNQTPNRCSRTQLESWYAFYPKTYRPSDEKLIAQLEKRYPDVQMDWAAALSKNAPHHSGDIYSHTFNIPILWTVAYPNESGRPDLAKWKAQKKWIQQQKELQERLKGYGIPWENFQWTFLNIEHELEDGRKVPAIKAIGLCTVLTVLRPIGEHT